MSNPVSKKTVQQVVDFMKVSKLYLARTEGAETKIAGHIRSIETKQVTAIYEDYNDTIADASRDNCFTEEGTGKIVRDSMGGYTYTIAGEKAREVANRAAGKKLYNITMRICIGVDEIIPTLTKEELAAFAGFVIPEPVEIEEAV